MTTQTRGPIHKTALIAAALLAVPATIAAGTLVLEAAMDDWAVHDMKRPQPVVVTPGATGTAPSDAIVLFDGGNLDAFRTGSPCERH